MLRLDEELSKNPAWERPMTRTIRSDMTTADNTTFITQWKMKSVEAALQDIPPELSPSKRYNRVYIV